MGTYIVTIIEIENSTIRQTSSYIGVSEEGLDYYTQGHSRPTVVGRNTSWVTHPTSWSFCVHVITKIS